MAHLFGHKWTSVYGEAVKDGALSVSATMWCEDLNRLTKDEIATGIEAIYALKPEWPPNPLEFAKICAMAKPKKWQETWQGIESKGRELGITLDRFPNFPSFKAEVMRAAKVAPLARAA